MSTLIVTAHPSADSLTAHAVRRLREQLEERGERVEVADLAAEGFDPRWTAADHAGYAARSRDDAGVLAEQARVDRHEHLVLAFPVYWWSMPALLKGWIDRVFIAGWAFDATGERAMLGRLTGHLLPVAATDEARFARHGYTEAFRTQIEHGVLDYCGVRRGVTAFVHGSEGTDAALRGAAVEAATSAIAAGIASAR
ncbi:NAD(P)H-dependent oxidoreductase [Arenivirga flava]|uniref:NAD(P)H dehydrogenase n=1 Tax=Arenivirga flava TaxID=1930060 RepID=A0AA37UFP7_9MICO|nr:NAD(P)H-dependent oxidoreductase [Arenivirga flava]GMA28495.1 NAD(P)H dehydrogenase [Arenivirga flava]